MFSGHYNTTYGFYSVALDNVGNIELPPSGAEAQTTVELPGFPTLLKQAANQDVLAGSTATFNVVAQGTAPLKYQWLKDTNVVANKAAKISGATSATLVISSVSTGDEGSYSVVVSNKVGAISSSNAVLQIIPGIKILSPAATAVFTNPAVNVTGTATDVMGPGLAQILWQLNGGAFQAARGLTNWTASVTLRAGTNIFGAKSVDQNDDESALVTRSFFLNVYKPITLSTNGPGGITGVRNGQLLLVGKNYTATAAPRGGNLFSNWTGSIASSANPLIFLMQSNMVLTANFVTNVFLEWAMKGTYNGLFAPANPPRRQTNSGAISFTLTSAGVVSGKLTIGTNTPSLNGQFDPSGAATLTTTRKGLSTLTTTLKLDFADQTASGSVTDGSFVAPLIADLEHKATHYDGPYTLILPGTDDPTVGPFGTSYGTVTVKSGAISFGGYLADGTGVSQSSYVSKDGFWPFYLPLYGGNGSLWSWNSFTNTNGAMIIFSTNASWINAANTSKTALYRTGFTNQATSIIGSVYNATDKPLLALTNGQVVLEGEDLPVTITNRFILTSKNAIILTNAGDTNKLTLTINKNTGVISGNFANPSNPKQTVKVNGVLLQNETNAQGYFLGTNQSGTFMLMPQ